VVYFLGDIVDGRFEVDRRGLVDHGDFYAPQSLRDGDRLLTWGWLPETRSTSEQWDAGWSGALSLLRVLSLGTDGRLRQRPAEEVTQLRTRRCRLDPPAVLDAGERHSLDADGRSLELRLDVSLSDASAVELSVFESENRSEHTAIRYLQENQLVVERAAASRDGVGAADAQRMPVTPYDAPLSLRAFLDRSVIELYANGRHCLTSRVYPDAGSTGVSIAAEGGRATVESLSVWELDPAVADPISPEPGSAGR
jgi:beta-fructofuranosidase